MCLFAPKLIIHGTVSKKGALSDFTSNTCKVEAYERACICFNEIFPDIQQKALHFFIVFFPF